MKPTQSFRPVCDERCDQCPYPDCINGSAKATQYQKIVGTCVQNGAIYHRSPFHGRKKEGESS